MNAPPFRLSLPVAHVRLRRLAPVLALALGAPLGWAQNTVGDTSPRISDYSRDPSFVQPKAVFFPPFPPPLDRPISHVVSPMPRRLTPPPELAAYIEEPFYAPLSTWLAEQALPAKLRQRLDAYREAKLACLRELRGVLEKNRDAEPAARRTALEAFARQQTPRLAELEKDAEQLRGDLATGANDWRALREWALGERNTRGDSPFEIASVMRAFAYYQSGLLPAQRRLLREITIELANAAEDSTAAQAAQPFTFFSPEPARVLLRDDLAGDVAAKLAEFQTKKSALKKELFDVVYKEDGAHFAFLRNSAIRSLAEKQAARLAELDRLAEEIRLGLAQTTPTAQKPPERSPLPPVLTERIGALLRARALLQKETLAKAEAVRDRAAAVPVQISYAVDNDIFKFVVLPRRVVNPAPDLREKARAIEAEFAAIAAEHQERFDELVTETNAIRAEAAKALGGANSRTLEAAISGATRVAALRDVEDGYRDYRTAVFEPGLSPEQRRLLFAGAIEELDLPLSRGEFQPIRRAASW